MISHNELRKFESTLKVLVDKLDDRLENNYGKRWPLHPARRQRGKTANKSHDGLFDIRGEFTLGLGSQHGKGYIIDIDMKTLDNIPENDRKKILDHAAAFLKDNLCAAFPQRDLSVVMEDSQIKIIGDFSLGKA